MSDAIQVLAVAGALLSVAQVIAGLPSRPKTPAPALAPAPQGTGAPAPARS